VVFEFSSRELIINGKINAILKMINDRWSRQAVSEWGAGSLESPCPEFRGEN